MTAFPVCAYCWAFIQAVTAFASRLLQHHFLGFGNCNLACFVSLQNIAAEGFVVSHLTGNQPRFDSFICVISGISYMSWTRTSVMLTHFPPLKPTLKCSFFHAYKNLTVINLLICENCSLILLAVTLPAPCVFICCAFCILNSFYTWVVTYSKQVFVYSHLSCSLGPPEGLSLVGCRELHVFTTSLCWIKIAFFLKNNSQTLLPVPHA